jgi:YYY domain-containing protein
METSGARSFWAGPRFWIVAILLFAAAARFINIEWDQRHFYHPDERAITYAVNRITLQPLNLDPDWFNYGTLPIYLTKLTTVAMSALDPGATSYDGVIVNGRRMSALMGTLTVVLTIVLGTRLYGWQAGLLAGALLAACPLHVQNSRFITVDVTLTFFVLLALMQMVRLSREGRTWQYLTAGACIGLAVATKFSAMPLFLPLGIAALYRWSRERRSGRFFVLTSAAVLAAIVAFALAEPYAIIRWERFVRDIREQSEMVRNAGLFPYTTQYMHTPKYLYELWQLVVWCMAPPLGLTALWATLARIGTSWRERRGEELVMLSWVIPFFLVSGWFEVKFPRYLLPIYPFLILWASAWLVHKFRSGSLVGRVGLPLVVAGTLAATLAFMSTYTRPHTVVTASEWFYDHVPAGSKVLSQDWDEGFPMPLPGRDGRRYEVHNFGYYERPDSAAKMQKLSQHLAQSDYVVFQTKRLYGALTRAPERFPYSVNYFYQLFAGDLGYTLVEEFASRPSLFGLEIPDELADESLTVYDHPKVLVFKNTGRLEGSVIFEKIMHGLPSVPLTRSDLLLARPAAAEESEGAALRSSGASEPVRSSLLALLYFALLVQLLGLAAYPVLRRWLRGAGTYALSKPIGVLLFSYFSWVIVSFELVSFTQGTLLVVIFVLLVVGALSWPRVLLEAPPSRAEITATEALFWGVFLLFVVVRAFNPEIFWGEKPMDFSFLNALNRTLFLPPPEPWFSGSALHYSYFGYYSVAALGKVLYIHPALTYNLGIALVAALTAAAAFGAGAAITGRWGTGLLAAVFATLLGNISGVFEWINRSGAVRAYDAWRDGHVGIGDAISQIGRSLYEAPLNFDYWWATSRVIEHTINEYPLWSFQFADLHAHVMVMPLTLTFVALTIHWVRRRLMTAGPLPSVRSGVPVLALLSLLLGAIVVTNAWSTPTYVMFFPFVVGAVWLTEAPRSGVLRTVQGLFTRVLLPTVALAAGAYVLFFPFWAHFTPPERNFNWERGTDLVEPQEFLQIFGLYMWALVPVLLILWARGLGSGERLRGWRLGLVVAAVAFEVLVFLAACGQASGVPLLATGVTNRIFLSTLFVLGVVVLLAPSTGSQWRVPVALAAFSFAVTTGTDLVYVWDRMNTIFKFYLESWFLMALAAAVAAPALWSGEVSLGRLRAVWRGGMVLLVLLALFTAITGTSAVVRTNRVPTPEPTLDGMAYLERTSAYELAAFEWLNRRVQGIPVILEAHGDSYREYTRVSMNTGLPTVLGWAYHVFQRAHPWPEINQRKADIVLAYTTDNKEELATILERYHVAMVFVGQVERRTYGGGNLERFKEWSDVLTPIYENDGVVIFGVNGRFSGGMPVTTIENVEAIGAPEAPRQQDDPGVLFQPRGIAVRGDTVIVADFGNHRIQELNTDLKYVRHWGKQGDLPGQFKEPCAVATDSQGLVYVADTWNQRVQVFSGEGKYEREWGAGFYGPRGIAVDAEGDVFVSDTGNNRILRFSSDGKQERAWGSKGEELGSFLEPMGIAVDAAGTVYVCDNGNGRLQMFTRDGQSVGQFPVEGWKSEVFSEPDVVVDDDGRIWVTVPVAKQIRAYDRKGAVLRTITSQSIASVVFATPMGIDYDTVRKRLVVSDLDGRVVGIPLEKK